MSSVFVPLMLISRVISMMSEAPYWIPPPERMISAAVPTGWAVRLAVVFTPKAVRLAKLIKPPFIVVIPL